MMASRVEDVGDEVKLTKKTKDFRSILAEYAAKFTKKTSTQAPEDVARPKCPGFAKFLIKVSTENPGWKDVVEKIIASVEPDEPREINFCEKSGYQRGTVILDPSTFLKALGELHGQYELEDLHFSGDPTKLEMSLLPE